MAKGKGIASLSEMVDTDEEDDIFNGDALQSPDSNQENGGARRKGTKAQTTTKRPTKKKAALERAGVTKSSTAARPGKKRAPLKDHTKQQYADETEEADEFAAQTEGDTVMDDVVEPRGAAKKSAPAKKGDQPTKKTTGRRPAEPQRDGEFEYTPTTAKVAKSTKTAPIPMKKKIIHETQPPTESDPSLPPEEEDSNEASPDLPRSTLRHQPSSRNTSQRRQPLPPRRRANSASDTDHDPTTRRKLGEMTLKFESLDLKYRNLREVGIKQAESNFEKLRLQSDAKSQLASDLIKSLKKELATHKALNADTTSIQNEIQTRDAELMKSRAQADALAKQLAEAQAENKALAAKLANSRHVSAAVESIDATRTPASGLRGRGQQQGHGVKTVMVGSAEAAQAAQMAQLKEDMYSDLTGLIMRGVDVGRESDVYDCIQTGANGSECFPRIFLLLSLDRRT